MIGFSTTKLTSKGQVVIPEQTRKRLGMKEGTQFMVLEGKDAVIFKVIQPPSMKDFDNLLSAARKQAKIVGLKPSDIKDAIKEVRSKQ